MKNRNASPEPEVHVITDLVSDAPEYVPGPPPAETTPSGRALYWHAFGGAIQGKRGGSSNFAIFTAGPVTKAADQEVRDTTIPGTDGETFRYLGSFTHDPSPADLDTLKPREYR